MPNRPLCALLLLLTAGPAGAATTYHVAPAGNDGDPGDATHPFRTLQHCATVAQAGDTCRAHAGVYRETVVPPRSGIAAAHIRYEAAPGECVTVSGSEILGGTAFPATWTPVAGSTTIWSTPTTAQFTQLFASGALLNEARWPDADPADLVHQPFWLAGPGTDQNGLVITGAAPSGSLTGGYVMVLAGGGWWSRTRKITAWDAVARRATFDRPVNGAEGPPAEGSRYALFGALPLLDKEGEWFLDTTAGKLYLWAPGGTNPGATPLEIKQRKWAFDVSSQSYIDIAGFNSFAAAIRLNGSSHCTIDGVRAQYVSAMRETDGWDLAPEVPAMIGDFNVWKNSVIAGSAASGIYVQGNDNQVVNNIIHDVDTAAIQRAGIELATSGSNARNLFAWNTVTRAGWAGLGLTGGSAGRVLYNKVKDAALLAWDSGALYAATTDGAGTEIAFNELSNVPYATAYGTGIYLDDGAKDFVVHHNYVHDLGWYGITFKHQDAIFNNTVLGAGVSPFNVGQDAQTGVWDAIGAALLFNNLIDASTPVTVALMQAGITDGGDFSTWVGATTAWQHLTVPFTALKQPSWAKPVAFDPTKAQLLQLRLGALGDFDLELDNLRLEGPAPKPVSDFESGLSSSFGTTWFATSASGSSAALAGAAPGAGCSLGAAELAGSRRALGYESLGVDLSPTANGTADLSAYTGVSFDLRARTRSWVATQYQLAAPLAPAQGLNQVCPLDGSQVPTTLCAQGKSQAVAPFTAGGADLGAFQSGAMRWTAGAAFTEAPGSCTGAPDVTATLPASGAYPATPPGTFAAQPFAAWADSCTPGDGGTSDAGADAGPVADAGVDGGPTADAGTTTDAGSTGGDGGPINSTGSGANVASGPGSGPPVHVDNSGAGCSGAGGAAWLAAAALALLARRRSRKS